MFVFLLEFLVPRWASIRCLLLARTCSWHLAGFFGWIFKGTVDVSTKATKFHRDILSSALDKELLVTHGVTATEVGTLQPVLGGAGLWKVREELQARRVAGNVLHVGPIGWPSSEAKAK